MYFLVFVEQQIGLETPTKYKLQPYIGPNETQVP